MTSLQSTEQKARLNFTRLVQRHPFIRRYLWQRQRGLCEFCGKIMKPDRFSIHHQSYDRSCHTSRRVQFRGCRGQVPPCHECPQTDLESCTVLLLALCRLCHRRLHAPFR